MNKSSPRNVKRTKCNDNVFDWLERIFNKTNAKEAKQRSGWHEHMINATSTSKSKENTSIQAERNDNKVLKINNAANNKPTNQYCINNRPSKTAKQNQAMVKTHNGLKVKIFRLNNNSCDLISPTSVVVATVNRETRTQSNVTIQTTTSFPVEVTQRESTSTDITIDNQQYTSCDENPSINAWHHPQSLDSRTTDNSSFSQSCENPSRRHISVYFGAMPKHVLTGIGKRVTRRKRRRSKKIISKPYNRTGNYSAAPSKTNIRNNNRPPLAVKARKISSTKFWFPSTSSIRSINTSVSEDDCNISQGQKYACPDNSKRRDKLMNDGNQMRSCDELISSDDLIGSDSIQQLTARNYPFHETTEIQTRAAEWDSDQNDYSFSCRSSIKSILKRPKTFSGGH